jgi:O-antigen biosynthesis protein
VTPVPDSRGLAGRMKKSARSLARKGLEKVPRAARAARSAYFSLMNHGTTQHRAYQTWLKAHDGDSKLVPGPGGPPSVSVLLDVTGQAAPARDRAVSRVLAQTYGNLDLTVLTDAEPPRVVDDRRHRVLVCEDGSLAWRVNAALPGVEGDFVVLVGPDDVLYPDSMALLARAAMDSPDADMVYGGDDVCILALSSRGIERAARRDPFFKPAWNPELLHSMPYLGRVTWLRTSRVLAAEGLRDLPGGEVWDLQLRLARGGATVVQAPGIVAGRVPSALPVPAATATAVLESALAAEGSATAVIEPGHVAGTWNVHYPVVGQPVISIVIPSKNAFPVVRRCVESIYATTSYPTFEVVLVDTGSDDPEVLRWYEDVARRHASFRLVDWPEQPFSYARSCNAGAEAARGEILVMLNNDTEVLEPSWLEMLVAEAQRPEVGVVGCLLLYPDGHTVQHAGIGLGIKTVAGNSLSGLRLDRRLTRTQELMLWTRRATTAVTAACIAVRKATYDAVGGFDPQLRITFNDVDLCLRIGALGYRSVYTPDVRLLHHESKSIAPNRDWTELFAAADLFRSRWADVVAHDPHLNGNLARTTTSYRLPVQGR